MRQARQQVLAGLPFFWGAWLMNETDPVDEMDEEVLAIRNNPELLCYLDECFRRARTEPRTSLQDLKSELGLDTDQSP